MKHSGRLLLAVIPAGLAATAVMPASAQDLTQFSLYRSNENQQTGPSTVVPFNAGTNYFFTSRGFESTATDFDSMVTIAPDSTIYPHGPAYVGNGGLIERDYQSGYMTKSQLDTTFSAGPYILSAGNSSLGSGATATQVYDGTDYYVVPPRLSTTTYSALNGLNPAASFTFSFLPFIADPATNVNGTFFTITDLTTGTTVFNDFVFDTSVDSFTVPANTLLSSESYEDELVFSSRIDSVDPPGSSCITFGGATCPGNYELAWDSRTFSDFTTGPAVPTPEPAGAAVLLVGLLSLGAVARRR